MHRTRILAFALVLIGLARSARAGNTYCVGGFQGTPPNHAPACNMPEARALHGCWHDHVFVTDGKGCYDCWDECDASCIWNFLASNPAFQPLDVYDCARLAGNQQETGILAHVVDGKPVVQLPPASKLDAKLDPVAQGPHGAGDELPLRGAVRDGNGAIRPITGGHFRVELGDGSSRDLPGGVAADGSIRGHLTLPPDGQVRVVFVPDPPRLHGTETMMTSVSSPLLVLVERCDLRAELVAPTQDEPLAGGFDATLRAVLHRGKDAASVPMPADAQLQFSLSSGAHDVVLLGARGATEVVWHAPGSPKLEPITITVNGTAGGQTICPQAPRTAWLSDAGLGVDFSGLQKRCYAGIPCKGTVALRRPAQGPGRAAVDARLADPAAVAVWLDTGTETRLPAVRGDDRYPLEKTYPEIGTAVWSVAFDGPGGRVVLPSHEIQVRPALKLALPAALDFGEVQAGTPPLRACQRLDFAQSVAAEEHSWVIEGAGLASCTSRPVFAYRDAAGAAITLPLTSTITVNAFDPADRSLSFCLEVPPCAGDSAPAGASIRVSPLTPEFASQSAVIQLRWRVQGKGLLGCHGWWLLPLLGLGGTAFMLAGVLSPARFPQAAAIRVSGSEAGLRRASAVQLRECPGASTGLFRSARLGLHGTGELNGQTHHALVVLRAIKGEAVVVTGHGPLEYKERRTGQLCPVADLATGHAPSSGMAYRCGDLWFSLENV